MKQLAKLSFVKNGIMPKHFTKHYTLTVGGETIITDHISDLNDCSFFLVAFLKNGSYRCVYPFMAFDAQRFFLENTLCLLSIDGEKMTITITSNLSGVFEITDIIAIP